jgi:hypothetical protein
VSTTTKGQKLLDLDIERTWMTATSSLISFGAIDSIGKHAGRNKGRTIRRIMTLESISVKSPDVGRNASFYCRAAGSDFSTPNRKMVR